MMVTVVEIAAYLGVTPGYVRQVIARNHIKPRGRRSRWKLYKAAEILRHTGHHRRSSEGQQVCVIDGCAGSVMARGWCSTHYGRWRRTGNPLLVTKVGTSPVVGYSAAHENVRLIRGRASKHVCIECGEQAFDWAYTHDDPHEIAQGRQVYSVDPEHYVPMCRTHHMRADVAYRRK